MKADCLASAAKAHLGDSIPHIHVLKLFGEEDDEEILSDSDKLAFPNALRAYLMTKLEDLKRGATVKGILPDCLVTVVDVKWYGSAAVELTYKDPASALSKACQYALTLWRKLTRFLEYPELELSNNLAENSMRPVALGRKNWLHIGSPQAPSGCSGLRQMGWQASAHRSRVEFAARGGQAGKIFVCRRTAESTGKRAALPEPIGGECGRSMSR